MGGRAREGGFSLWAFGEKGTYSIGGQDEKMRVLGYREGE
jgi:hypothetical protein